MPQPRRFAAALVIAAALTAPAGASAALPTFPSTRIVPGTSIAGVKLGAGADAAIAAWGGNAECPAPYTGPDCTWRAADGGATATLYFVRGKVSVVSVRIGTSSTGTPIFKGPLMGLKLRKKLGLRATIAQLLKAYPKLAGSPSGAALGRGSRTTTFSTSGGPVTEISIGALS